MDKTGKREREETDLIQDVLFNMRMNSDIIKNRVLDYYYTIKPMSVRKASKMSNALNDILMGKVMKH